MSGEGLVRAMDAPLKPLYKLLLICIGDSAAHAAEYGELYFYKGAKRLADWSNIPAEDIPPMLDELVSSGYLVPMDDSVIDDLYGDARPEGIERVYEITNPYTVR